MVYAANNVRNRHMRQRQEARLRRCLQISDKTLNKLRHLPNVDYMLSNRGAMQIQAFKLG